MANMDWNKLVSLMPALGAMTQGGPEFEAFMQGYQQTQQLLERQVSAQREMANREAETSAMRERWAAQDATAERSRSQRARAALLGELPDVADEAVASVPPTIALPGAPFGLGEIGGTVATGIRGQRMREALDAAAGMIGGTTADVDALMPAAPMALSRAERARMNRIRSDISKHYDKIRNAYKDNPDAPMQAEWDVPIHDGSVIRLKAEQIAEIAGMPPITATMKAGGSGLTGEPGNRYAALRAAWEAENPGVEVPPKLNAQWKKSATDEAYRETSARNNAGLTTMQGFQVAEKLAAAWSKESASMREMQRQFGLMQTGLRRFDKDPNGGSQAILVTFQKILDPMSVVRESEYARSSQGVSLLSRIEGYAERLAQGGAGVPKSDLAEMVETAREFTDSARAYADTQRGRIEAQAAKYGIDPVSIFGLNAGGVGAQPKARGIKILKVEREAK